MKWEKAELVNVDLDAYYLVQTNGAEWRDFDLRVMSGHIVAEHLSYVRGIPMWICKIIRPGTETT